MEEFSAHRADLFMCYENPITLNKLIISVTSAEAQPDKYVVRISNDSRKVSSGSSYCYPDNLRRIGYNAKKAGKNTCTRKLFVFMVALVGKKEVDPDLGNIVPSNPSYGSCTLTALVDDRGEVYAFRGDISIVHNGKMLLKATQHMAIDYERLQ